MLDIGKIRGISLDLDDTLWPIRPTIERAEKSLHDWLAQHAPTTAALYASPAALREIREQMAGLRPELAHDLSAMRRESIRLALQRAGDDPALAEPAFEVFFAERQSVRLFEDAAPALEFLAARFPLVALSNGNADVHRVGLGRYFHAAISAHAFGAGKPNPRIFHAAAAAAELLPEQLLHVGDDALLDALAARQAGMQAVWVNRSALAWPHEEQPHATVAGLAELCRLFR